MVQLVGLLHIIFLFNCDRRQIIFDCVGFVCDFRWHFPRDHCNYFECCVSLPLQKLSRQLDFFGYVVKFAAALDVPRTWIFTWVQGVLQNHSLVWCRVVWKEHNLLIVTYKFLLRLYDWLGNTSFPTTVENRVFKLRFLLRLKMRICRFAAVV